LPGGVKSLEKLRLEKKVLDFIYQWDKLGKIIASTCHGAQLLISSKIVKGRKISGYYSLEDDVNNAGAIYSRDPVVVDKNIVSSPHYDFMGEWMEEALAQHKKWKH
jgi:protease I